MIVGWLKIIEIYFLQVLLVCLIYAVDNYIPMYFTQLVQNYRKSTLAVIRLICSNTEIVTFPPKLITLQGATILCYLLHYFLQTAPFRLIITLNTYN